MVGHELCSNCMIVDIVVPAAEGIRVCYVIWLSNYSLQLIAGILSVSSVCLVN